MAYTLTDIKVGQRVRYRHNTSAISCCHNGGTVSGEGVVNMIFDFRNDPPIGIERRPGDATLHCVFAHEIVEIVGETPE